MARLPAVSYAAGMRTPEVSSTSSRETRLLLVTIAISVGVLLLLARFRFPEAGTSQTVESAPAPLERLAARAAYDELASIMADLERRITPRVTVARMQSADGGTFMAVAPRLLPDRAVALIPSEDGAGMVAGSEHELIAHDLASGVVVMRVPAVDESAVTIRQGPLRSGPRYVGLVVATAIGPALQPLYVGRVETSEDPRTGTTLLTFAGHQIDLRPGSAIFSLEGAFIGLVRDRGDPATVVPAEQLRNIAQAAQAPSPQRGDLGVQVDGLTAALLRATGAEQGAMVVHVRAGGPADGALKSGDVIQSVDGTAVRNALSFRELERSRTPGADVRVTVMRARSPVEFTIKAGDVSTTTTGGAEPGVVGRNVSGVGIEVVAVLEGSAAERAGLRRGDLIVALDGERRPDTAQFTRRFRGNEPVTALVTVQRAGDYFVLALETR